MREDRLYIDNRLFYLAWNNHRCCNLKSVGRTNISKVELKPFNTKYQDRVLNLTDEKTLKDMKRHEKTRTKHYKMQKDRIFIDKICLFSLE